MEQMHPRRRKAYCPRSPLVSALVIILLAAGGTAQQKGALTNASIISMVKGGTSESVILYAMKNGETDFDTGPSALQELKKAGVSQRLIDAMAAARTRAVSSAGASPVARSGSAPGPREPYVMLVKEKENRAIPPLQARVTSAKVEKRDLGSLAAQGVVTRALENTADLAVDATLGKAESSLGSAVATPVAGVAKSVLGGLLSRKPKLTFLWAIPVQVALTAVPSDKPKFEVHYRQTPGVNGEDFTPLIVRLVREKKDDWRLVGAAEGATDALEQEGWELYDDFTQEEVKCSLTDQAKGAVLVEPRDPLVPGEYALVLRPTSDSREFSGPDVAEGRNEGRLFNTVWGFRVGTK